MQVHLVKRPLNQSVCRCACVCVCVDSARSADCPMPCVIFTALQSIGQNSLRAIEKSGFPVDTFESSNMESARLFVIFSRSFIIISGYRGKLLVYWWWVRRALNGNANIKFNGSLIVSSKLHIDTSLV